MTDDMALPPGLGPAAAAARRTQRRPSVSRAYPQPLDADLSGDAVVLAAVRALLHVRTREEAAQVVRTAVADLGGGIVPARLAETHPDALGLDVSLGVGEPMQVVVPAPTVAALQLIHHLPGLVQDALTAAGRCDVALRLSELARPREPEAS